MSRYLEEAAQLVRAAAADVEKRANRNVSSYNSQRLEVAQSFAMLAAIDKGLLPADITADVLRAITDRHAA